MNTIQINEAIVKFVRLSGYPKQVEYSIVTNYGDEVFNTVKKICFSSFNDPIWADAHDPLIFQAGIEKLINEYPYLSDESANIIGNMAAFFMK